MIRHKHGAKWTAAEIEEIRANYADKKQREWAEELGISLSSFKSLVSQYGIKKDIPAVWDAEKDKQMRELYATSNTDELARMFGTTHTAVLARAQYLHLHKVEGFNLPTLHANAFKPGNIPHNKGRKMSEYTSEAAIERIRTGQFKQGHVPYNVRPVWSERITTQGYVEIKVPGLNIFKPKHVVVWESAHGPVPPHHIVVFKDGDKSNITLENLQLISKAENLSRQNIYTLPPKLQRTIRLLASLNRKINKIQKENKKL